MDETGILPIGYIDIVKHTSEWTNEVANDGATPTKQSDTEFE